MSLVLGKKIKIYHLMSFEMTSDDKFLSIELIKKLYQQ